MKKALTLIVVLCVAAMLFAACGTVPPVDPTEPTNAPTEPTVAPTDPPHVHTPEADDGDCTTAVMCADCGEVAIAAKTHTGKDDGDVTTPVVCENENCTHEITPAKEAITLTIPELVNGRVVTDKKNYAIGDTVVLAIFPDAGYAQKLYINGEPLMLDWKNFVYTFEATENVYEITGSFVESLDLKASDDARWDATNQAHGVLTTYYPANGDSWWMGINGEYQAMEIIAKNYLPKEASMDGNGQDGYQQLIRFGLSNGKNYAFRIYNDKGTYAVSCSAISGSAAGWGNWKNVESILGYSIDEAMAGDGVQFKVERTAADTMTISVNGVTMFTYKMDGVTEADKVTFVGTQSNKNTGKYVEIPFALTVPTEEPPVTEPPVTEPPVTEPPVTEPPVTEPPVTEPPVTEPPATEPPVDEDAVTVTIGTFANGTVTADKESYKIGDTVTLTVTPAAGHFQKLYINGEPLMLGWKTFNYTFVATKNVYEITGSFATGLSLKPGDWGRWDDHNQLHGVLNTYYPNNGDSWWMDINGEYKSMEITAKNYLPKGESMDNQDVNPKVDGYQQIIRFGLSNGNKYAFRIYNDKGTYAVSCTGVSGSSAGWGNWKNVAGVLGYSIDEAMAGDGVQFKVERTSADTMTISVNGVTMFTYTMDGVTEADKVTFVGTQSNQNKGQYVDIPFVVE